MSRWRGLTILLFLVSALSGCVGLDDGSVEPQSVQPTGTSAAEPTATPQDDQPDDGADDENATKPDPGSTGGQNGTSGGQDDPPGDHNDTAGGDSGTPPPPPTSASPSGFVPHVLVGVPDTGINPYHEIFYRPALTEHPCTYIRDFPCDIPALPLSIGVYGTWQASFDADKALWESVKPGDWFWIPKTVFVAVGCESAYEPELGDLCILDDSHMHGTATTSSVLMENPDALIAFKEGGSAIQPFIERGLPIDIFSVSWSYVVPIPVLPSATAPIYVKSAGNDARPGMADGWAGDPRIIAVGGAFAQDNSEAIHGGKQPEIVSYFCRPTAQTQSLAAMRPSYCGTSFAAPTAAGGLSTVILGLRTSSGWTGSIADGFVDPVAGITVRDLRDAMNRTASYDPDSEYENTSLASVPLNPLAPWVQWGWGFYDGTVAEATLGHLLKAPEAPPKPAEAQTYMETQYAAKQATHPLA